MTTSVATSLSNSLGINTGIDTASLVQQLTDATYADKLAMLSSRISNANAQISAVASAKSSLDTFSSALTNLLKSSAYSGQPGSSDPTTVSVSPLPGGTPQGLPAQIEVKQLAQAQVLRSAAVTGPTVAAGVGTLTLSVGAKTYDVTLASPSNTLADLASAINNTRSGVTATVVSDKSGSRLVLKGDTGQDNAFTLTPKLDPGSGDAMADADLQRFTFDGTTGGMSKTQDAQDAKIAVDNIDMQFASNTITTAIPYLSLELNKAAPGATVTIATDQPTKSMSDLLSQIVDAYNTLKGALNTSMRTSDGTASSSSGLLSNDSGARTMSNSLAQLVTTVLNPDGKYKTLSSIGVSTNRDGTLSLDTTRLQAALADDPAGVTQMLNPTTRDDTHIGIDGALSNIVTTLEADKGPLASSTNTYTNLVKNLNKQLDATNDQKSSYSDRLTNQFTAMQTMLLQLKSTQSYLQQQIDVWNSK